MATLIDSLVVQLGLDATGFNKGQKAATESFKKTGEEAVKTGKSIEASGKQASDALETIARKALALFAVFTAGKGIKEFTADIISATAAMGRLATGINAAPDAISAVTMAVERSGGSADGAAQAFQTFSDHMQELKTTGETSILPFLVRLQRAGGKQIDLNKAVGDTFADLADDVGAVAKKDPALANYMARQITGDAGLAQLMMRGGDAFRAELAESQRHGLISKEDAEAAAGYQRAWNGITQSVRSFWRTLVTAAEPAIVRMLTHLNTWIDQNRGWIDRDIIGGLSRMSTAFDDFSKKFFGQDGLATAFEAFGIMMGLKVLAPLTSIVGLLGRLGGLSLPTWVVALLVGAGYLSKQSADTLQNSKPGANDVYVDPETGLATSVAPGSGNQVVGQATGGGIGGWWRRHAPTWAGGRPTGAGRAAFGRHIGMSHNDNPEIVSYIRAAAAKRGIEPDAALAVAGSEGLHGYDPTKPDNGGDQGTSFGPWQLHYKNNLPGLSNPGMGDDFTRATGLDARDPKNWRAATDFALDHAKKYGWSAWHGATRIGMGRWDGIGTYKGGSTTTPSDVAPVVPHMTYNELASLAMRTAGAHRQRDKAELRRAQTLIDHANGHTSMLTGAAHVARLSEISRTANDNRTIDNSSRSQIGAINVNTQATDAAGIARDIRPYLELGASASHKNYGLA